MNWFKRLDIAPSEMGPLKFLWSLRFLWQVGFVFAWTVITAVFIEIFGTSQLLYLFLVDAWLMIIGSYMAHVFFLKFNQDLFLKWMCIGTMASLGLAAGLHLYGVSVFLVFAALLIAKDFFFFQMHIGILRKNESMLSPKEAQRIMPIIDTANTVGIVVGAMMFLGLLEIMPLKQTLVFWMLVLVGMGILILKESRWIPVIPRIEKPQKPQMTENIHGFHEAIQAVKSIKFLRFMAAVIVIQAALFTLVEYKFLVSIEASVTEHQSAGHEVQATDYLQANLFQDVSEHVKAGIDTTVYTVAEQSSKVFAHHSVAHDLGMFELICGIMALLVQLFMTSKVIQRCGIIYSILGFFGTFLALAMAFVFGGLGIKWVKGFYHSFHSIFHTAYHLSFYSIFSHSREKVRHFFEGFIYPAGIIIGVGIMTLSKVFFENPFPYLMLAALLLLVGLLIPMKREFTRLSHANLSSPQNIEATLHSIEVLSQNGHVDSALKLGEELMKKDKHPVVREKIIQTLADINDPRIVHTYLKILIDPKEVVEVKIQILESLLRINKLGNYWAQHAFAQYHLLERLKELFASTSNPYLRKLIVMNIFVHLPTDQVVPFFLEVLGSEDQELKSICLRSASEIFDDPEVSYYLRGYLDSSNAKLRGYALISLWRFEPRASLRPMLDEMLESQNPADLIAGIYAVGEIRDLERELVVLRYLDHPNDEVYLHTLVALAKLESYEVIPDIVRVLFGSDRDAADKLFYMLKRAPENIQKAIAAAVSFEVSQQVAQTLSQTSNTPITSEIKAHLKRLYRLAGKYDEILILETV